MRPEATTVSHAHSPGLLLGTGQLERRRLPIGRLRLQPGTRWRRRIDVHGAACVALLCQSQITVAYRNPAVTVISLQYEAAYNGLSASGYSQLQAEVNALHGYNSQFTMYLDLP